MSSINVIVGSYGSSWSVGRFEVAVVILAPLLIPLTALSCRFAYAGMLLFSNTMAQLCRFSSGDSCMFLHCRFRCSHPVVAVKFVLSPYVQGCWSKPNSAENGDLEHVLRFGNVAPSGILYPMTLHIYR